MYDKPRVVAWGVQCEPARLVPHHERIDVVVEYHVTRCFIQRDRSRVVVTAYAQWTHGLIAYGDYAVVMG